MAKFFKGLVFAKVSELIMKPKNCKGDPWLTPKGYYKYYCGLASTKPINRNTTSQSVFFQLNKHIQHPIYIGPIEWHPEIPCHLSNCINYGDIIFGETVMDKTKRLRFRWWSSNANALFFLRKLLQYKSKQRIPANEIYKKLSFRQRTRNYRCEECKHPSPSCASAKYKGSGCEVCGSFSWEFVQDLPKKTELQDLWLIYSLLVHNKMDELVAVQRQRPSHYLCPFTKSNVHASHPPQRFVFLLAWYCGNRDLYVNFVECVKKTTMPSDSFTYLLTHNLSIDNLEYLINLKN